MEVGPEVGVVGAVGTVAALALLEVRNDRLHPIERGLYIHGHHQVELLVGELEDRCIDALSRVVDPHVHRTESGQRLIREICGNLPLTLGGRGSQVTPASVLGY